MADVRSLLRNERASRRITHPHATYSISGTLACLVCHVQLKSESLWGSHLASSQHVTRLQQIRDGTLEKSSGSLGPTNSSIGARVSRKRKADGEEEDERKRVKAPNGLPHDFFDKDEGEDKPEEFIEDEPVAKSEPAVSAPQITVEQLQQEIKPPGTRLPPNGLPPDFFDPSTKVPPPPTASINEDEWAAFERDVASPPPESSTLAALHAAATITAAPLTAAEIAARSREEASMQAKEKREVELEGEKEDATRRLEEEFDEMEELEERVRRLREKREEIRRRGAEENVATDGGGSELSAKAGAGAMDGVENEDEDEDDEEDDEWDGWGLR
ncbi:MAG: hypothetical protein Q9187_001569 [Circinaria calcarea]